MDINALLKELSLKTAISGYEKSMSSYVKGLFENYCEKVDIDSFFNVTGFKKGLGGSKKIMVTAHYDEIGFLVTGIDEKGFVRFSNIGGIDSKILLAQEVVIHGKRDIFGVIGAKPPHLLKAEEQKKAVKLEDLVIDTGFGCEKLKEYVSIGDMITFKSIPFELQGSKLSSKSVDNRCGVAALVEVLKELECLKFKNNVFVTATTQEEVGLRGAKTAAYSLNPDLAIVIDACHGDITDGPKGETFSLGKGPAIGIGPNLHKNFTKRLIDVAKEEGIPYQIDVEPGDTGTEAWALQVSRCGIPTLLVSIPVRYMHTTVETVNICDIRNAARLISRFVHKVEGEMEESGCC